MGLLNFLRQKQEPVKQEPVKQEPKAPLKNDWISFLCEARKSDSFWVKVTPTTKKRYIRFCAKEGGRNANVLLSREKVEELIKCLVTIQW